MSYLPEFALSYRVVQAWTFEAFLDGKLERRDVERWKVVLQDYARRMERHAEALWRTIGCGFGRAPPRGGALWPWLKEACGRIRVRRTPVGRPGQDHLFRRYQCHQSAVA